MAQTPAGGEPDALATLQIRAGPQTGEAVTIRLPVVSIGRGSHNDVVLTDDSVSSAHARLEYGAGEWQLTDLESINGTYIGAARLAPHEATPVPPGAVVRFGFVRAEFLPVEAADPAAARAAYTPPQAEPGVRDRRSGFRLPVWFVVLLLMLVVLGILLFGWLWSEPVAAPEPAVSLATALAAEPPERR